MKYVGSVKNLCLVEFSIIGLSSDSRSAKWSMGQSVGTDKSLQAVRELRLRPWAYSR